MRHRLPPDIAHRAILRLLAINSASDIDSLRQPPSNHLELLSGDRAGQHSIRINQQYRICFTWDAVTNHANDVEIADYH